MTAVLSVAFVGAAHALSVDIVVPETDPAEVYPQVRVRFLAEARDEKGNDVSDRATFSWAFSDAEDSTVGNPVLHRFPKVGKFLASVTATIDSDSGCDETTVIVVPYEGGQRDDPPEPPNADDFTFTANGHLPVAEVSDDVTLLVEQVGDIAPFEWYVTEFQRYENGQWVAPEDQCGWCSYGWYTTEDSTQKNGPVQWRAKVMLDEPGAENPLDIYLPATWIVANTVVKARASDPPLIFHHAEDTSHTIGWELTHCEDADPRFTMTVTIYDLPGNTVATLPRYNVPLQEQNPEIVWDTDLPQTDGIYTYRIHASHNPPPPYYACVDDDKSQVLTISDVSTPEWDLEVLSATQAELTYSVSYQLSRDATWIGVSIYDQNFQPIVSAASLPTTSGSHQSDTSVVPITLTEGWHGPYSVVVYGWESEEDGANNRDGLIKRALQRGGR